MNPIFRELHDKHSDLLQKSFTDLPKEQLVEEAQSLLQELRSAGCSVGDLDQRKRLKSYADHWGSFIFEHRGNYPITTLKPPDPEKVTAVDWGTSLDAALEASLDILAEAGFGEDARSLKGQLMEQTEKARWEVFERAFTQAAEVAGTEGLWTLLDHRPLRKASITALLDPVQGFDLRAAAMGKDDWRPVQVLALRRFFSSLENALLADETWGLLLENYYGLRFRPDVKEALEQRQRAGLQVVGAGDYATQTQVIADPGRVWQAISHRPPPRDLRRATARYLTYLVDSHRYLSLKGMGVSDRVPLRLPLDEMYVPLKARVELPEGETWSRKLRLAGREVPDEERGTADARLSTPRPVLDLLREQDGLILLGDPGAGKTTFLKILALGLATGQAEHLDLGVHLPVLIPLSAYANALAEGEVRLDDFIAAYFHNLGADLPIGDLLREALAQGGALVLLDGLDEVQDPALRELVAERVVDFYAFHRRAGNKFVLSSRVVGYREVRPVAEGLAECTLVDFEDEEIQAFVTRWTATLERAAHGDTPVAAQEAARERQELLEAIQNNPGVRRLAANPLLLTILALMKRQGVTLPERRVELYEQYVRTLLSSWNRARGLGRPPARDLDVVETVRILAPLALWMHETSPGVGLVKQGDLRRELVEIYRQAGEDAPERAGRRFLRDVREHASLLLERGAGQYGFIHLTFEEYLAAVGVARLGQRDIAPVVELLSRHVGDAAWREVALLTVGYLGIVQQQEQVAGDVVAALLAQQPGEPGQAVTLAGEAVVDAWPGGVTLECKEGVVRALVRTLGDDGRVAAPLRAEAGRALARLGDPRFRADAWHLPDEPRLGFVEIPAGPFLMGTREEDFPALKERFGEVEWYKYEWETPQHEIALPTYYVARYPVTQAQFWAFVEADGYQERRYWREAEAVGRWQDGQVKRFFPRFDEKDEIEWVEEQAAAPYNFGLPYNLPNHPVVGVTWYEALAYCRWLTERLSESANERISESANRRIGESASQRIGESASGAEREMWEGLAAGRLVVRLPSEAEWEKAARGALPPSGGDQGGARRFPWGDEPDPNRANYDETGIGYTSAVGCFPDGASPYGCLDMAGNVWEWTSSLWGEKAEPEFKYPYDPTDGRENLEAGDRVGRVLRGGAFYNDERGTRCTYRNWYDPDFRYWYFGFRVVAAPSPPSLASGNSALGHSGTSALRREA
jgi:formylglycine-generating enzyme required for sulfatase activity